MESGGTENCTKKNKFIPVMGCGGQWGCEKSKLQHFLDYWATDGSEVIFQPYSLAVIYSQEDFWYSFLFEAV
jgi:hypothetical protein